MGVWFCISKNEKSLGLAVSWVIYVAVQGCAYDLWRTTPRYKKYRAFRQGRDGDDGEKEGEFTCLSVKKIDDFEAREIVRHMFGVNPRDCTSSGAFQL